MFRQICVDPQECDPNKEVGHYHVITVTYGTALAEFLAIRYLQQIAEENSSCFLLAL